MNGTGITARQISIGFKGKRYYIGSYESYDEAVEARVNAENQDLFVDYCNYVTNNI